MKENNNIWSCIGIRACHVVHHIARAKHFSVQSSAIGNGLLLLSFLFPFFFYSDLQYLFDIIYSPWISQNPMPGCMAFSGLACIITTYLNKKCLHDLTTHKKANLHLSFFFFLWLIYTFFHFGVLSCIIFT